MCVRSAAPTSAGTGTNGTPAIRHQVIASTVVALGVASTATRDAPPTRSATDVAAPTRSLVIDVDESAAFQTMVGFGAALTDASALLIHGLPASRRDTLMRELFGGEPGIGLSFVRLPMGASDF